MQSLLETPGGSTLVKHKQQYTNASHCQSRLYVSMKTKPVNGGQFQGRSQDIWMGGVGYTVGNRQPCDCQRMKMKKNIEKIYISLKIQRGERMIHC